MDGLIKKKLNALAQIARIDGHFADAEKDVLQEIAKQYGKNDDELMKIIENPEPLDESYSDISAYHKIEFMYIALRVMRADGLIHDSEVDFCKLLATKMNIDPSIVDEFSTVEEFDFESFKDQAEKYLK